MPLRIRPIAVKLKAATLHELHANSSPLRASLSLGLGILVGFCPLYGLHTPIVIALAFLLRLNRVLALLAASTTILPFVPFWLAAGIFTGKHVVSLETASRLVDDLRHFLPANSFDAILERFIHLTRRLFTPELLSRVTHGPHPKLLVLLSRVTHSPHQKHLSLGAFVQWVIGCSVFAIVSSIVTFAVSFPTLTFLHGRRKKRLGGPD